MQVEEMTTFIIEKAEDIKAYNILLLDVSKKSTVTDHMIICSGTSTRHVKSIAESIALEAKKEYIDVLGIEGLETSEWVLLDLGDVVVHVMQESAREFYELEKLWR